MNIIKRQKNNAVKLKQIEFLGMIIIIDLLKTTLRVNTWKLSYTTMMKCFKPKSIMQILSKRNLNLHTNKLNLISIQWVLK